ncbi:hypothetical protein HYV10_00865 [Candidatus Dependentiae bacterium]|nr:hypothetical protein [Candidatus Dependentiae bacterium]
MNFKYISTYIFLTLALTTNIFADNEDASFDFLNNDTSFDLIDISSGTENKGMNFDPLDNLVTDITPSDLSSIRSQSCSPEERSFLLGVINTFNASAILNQPFYRRTSVPVSRNLINYPNTQIITYSDLADRQFTTHIFANITPKKNFCNSQEFKPGTRIGSYLNIENKEITNLFNSIQDSPLIGPDIKMALQGLNINRLLKTLGDARFEERRIGLFGHYYHIINDTTYFQAKLPFFWMERNLNFSTAEKEIIDRELSAFSGSEFDEDAFAKKHLIFDSLGFGTLELNVNTKIWEGINWHIDFGGGLLLPTDYQVMHGLYGTYFKANDCQPILNLCQVIDVKKIGNSSDESIFQPDGKQNLEKYFVGALDRLSSILLQCQHGYNKHLGIDLNAYMFWQIKPDFAWNTKYCVEFLLPREQNLFFIPRQSKNPEETFSKLFNKIPQATEEEQKIKLDIFQAKLTELLYPRVFTVKVFPGFIFNSASCLQKTFRNWNFSVGTSSYYQTAEKILSGLTREQRDFYDTEKAVNESLYHFKLFGKIHRVFHTRRHNDFSIGLWADGTVWNNGLGNDLSIGISFDSKF